MEQDRMKALVCHAFGPWDGLRLEEAAAPGPLAADEVRIAAEYSSVSFATGLMVEGKYQRRPPLPFVPGTECIGIVTEVGSAVTRIRPGQRVAATLDWGGYAQQVVVAEYTVYPMPDGIDPRAAMHLPLSYGTAYGALVWSARLMPGETLLVTGAAGGVGIAAVQVGKALGARVIAVASTEEKRAFVLSQGADIALPTDGFRDEVKKLTGGRGVDVVFDPVGGPVFDACLRSCAQYGRMLIIGFAQGQIQQVPANLLLVKNIVLHGFYFGAHAGWGLADERAQRAPKVQAMMDELFAWTVKGRLKPHVSHAYPMERYREAMAALQARASLGKVVLEIER
ncbi:MAG: NADPH:quinone oxidoreductase family protein [bacterium]